MSHTPDKLLPIPPDFVDEGTCSAAPTDIPGYFSSTFTNCNSSLAVPTVHLHTEGNPRKDMSFLRTARCRCYEIFNRVPGGILLGSGKPWNFSIFLKTITSHQPGLPKYC